MTKMSSALLKSDERQKGALVSCWSHADESVAHTSSRFIAEKELEKLEKEKKGLGKVLSKMKTVLRRDRRKSVVIETATASGVTSAYAGPPATAAKPSVRFVSPAQLCWFCLGVGGGYVREIAHTGH